MRLDQLRKLPEAQLLLAHLDSPDLLSGVAAASADVDDLDGDTLLAALGVGDVPVDQNDITVLRHVRSSVEKRTVDEIAERTPCVDFDKFQPLFERAERELKANVRKTLRFGRDASIASGNYFIVGGQLAYVAEIGETIKAPLSKTASVIRLSRRNGFWCHSM